MPAAPKQPVAYREDLSRRELLRAGSLGALGLGLGLPASLRVWSIPERLARRHASRCIFINLVGGPSQLDTWDPKPDAPSEVRSPFAPIATRVPGVFVSELFPKLAGILDKVALVRSVHHTSLAVHDIGHQLIQTGRLATAEFDPPHVGCVLARLLGPCGDVPAHVVLPRPIGNTGGNLSHGQTAGALGREFDPYLLVPERAGGRYDSVVRDALELTQESDAVRDDYGRTPIGSDCLAARRLVERGTRFVTVNMYHTVFHQTSWDAHGAAPFGTLDAYRAEVGPSFDAAFTALIRDLAGLGLLDSTMVLACGEFGRTPRLNRHGGRDHHAGCWTILCAGGPIQGGRVVGASDAIGREAADRPVTPAEIVATLYQGFGIPLGLELANSQGQTVPLVVAGTEPIRGLF